MCKNCLKQEVDCPGDGSTTSLNGVDVRRRPTVVHLTAIRTEWNEKIDDVVAGLDSPSGLWLHEWMKAKKLQKPENSY